MGRWPTGLPITTPQWDIAYTETWGPGYDALTSLTDFTYVWPAEVKRAKIRERRFNDKIDERRVDRSEA